MRGLMGSEGAGAPWRRGGRRLGHPAAREPVARRKRLHPGGLLVIFGCAGKRAGWALRRPQREKKAFVVKRG